MPFSQKNGLRYFQFESLHIRHAVFSRYGGISPEPWASLNVGGSVGDNIENVRKNRLISFDALGCDPDSMFDAWQVHGTDVVFASPRCLVTRNCAPSSDWAAVAPRATMISGLTIPI
jgi:copper oxidase (laccase) domain-containing protein